MQSSFSNTSLAHLSAKELSSKEYKEQRNSEEHSRKRSRLEVAFADDPREPPEVPLHQRERRRGESSCPCFLDSSRRLKWNQAVADFDRARKTCNVRNAEEALELTEGVDVEEACATIQQLSILDQLSPGDWQPAEVVGYDFENKVPFIPLRHQEGQRVGRILWINWATTLHNTHVDNLEEARWLMDLRRDAGKKVDMSFPLAHQAEVAVGIADAVTLLDAMAAHIKTDPMLRDTLIRNRDERMHKIADSKGTPVHLFSGMTHGESEANLTRRMSAMDLLRQEDDLIYQAWVIRRKPAVSRLGVLRQAAMAIAKKRLDAALVKPYHNIFHNTRITMAYALFEQQIINFSDWNEGATWKKELTSQEEDFRRKLRDRISEQIYHPELLSTRAEREKDDEEERTRRAEARRRLINGAEVESVEVEEEDEDDDMPSLED